MIKSFSNRLYSRGIIIFLAIAAHYHLCADSRSDEIKQMMWHSGDPYFQVTEVPEKWQNKSAVVLAQSNHLEYRKDLILAYLNFHNYTHERIKLLDQRALEEYAHVYIPEDGTYNGTKYKFYASYKIIKPDGREIEIPLSSAVKEQREINNKGYDQKKLALPNLEIGDILDFYNVEEQTIRLYYTFHAFDPFIFQLHRGFPIVNRKVSFDVQRRCFINTKSLNGAPELLLTEDSDKNSYFLEVQDLESVKDIRWLFPNRALPTIKLKVTYAGPMASVKSSDFLGKPGVLKSTVENQELSKFLETEIKENYSSAKYFGHFMKKHFKREKNLDNLAREALYALRNHYYVSRTETITIEGNTPKSVYATFKPVAVLSQYYRSKKIPHELIIVIRKQISSIEQLILEEELDYMIKVNTSKPFYIGLFNNHSIVGEIDEDFQGVKAYSINGLTTSNYKFKTVNVPTTSHEQNATKVIMKCSIDDWNEGEATLDIFTEVSGVNRRFYQHALMDIYDYMDEEREKFRMPEDFDNYVKASRHKLLQQKADYLANREKDYLETLKKISENDFDFTINEAKNYKILSTGRHHKKPEFKATFQLKASGIVKKAGPNYILDVGKLIEKQLEINKEERERTYDIYMNYARSYAYRIEVDIPYGHEAQGLEKLNVQVENETGGFTSKSYMEGNKLIVDTYKYYKSPFEPKENWGKMCEFLDAAYKFTEQNIVVRQKVVN
jgi:hypothetical protein